jgi:hypothetical protein
MFRFTIRDVLWLTVVAAVAFSWRADRDRLHADKLAAEQDARDFWRSTLTRERADELKTKYLPGPEASHPPATIQS